jgi:hypothetical protein
MFASQYIPSAWAASELNRVDRFPSIALDATSPPLAAVLVLAVHLLRFSAVPLTGAPQYAPSGDAPAEATPDPDGDQVKVAIELAGSV